MSGDKGKNAKAALVTQLIAGAKKRFTNGKQQVPVGGQNVTISQVVSTMQQFVDNRAAVVQAKATTSAKVAAENEAAPSLLAIIAAFVTFVRLTFGNQADALADFGLPPPKARTPQTAEQKAVAVARREATREARGTTGKKAKQNVKGNVTAQLVVTPGTPAEPSTPAASPAPAAGGNAPATGSPPAAPAKS